MENLLAVGRYLWCVIPQVRIELAYWHTRADQIDDPNMRALAVGKLRGEWGNIESAAFFALLAGCEWRSALKRIVAFQLAYELLDGLNETQPMLKDGLRLHGALTQAIGGPSSEHDGGPYLQELVDVCCSLNEPSQTMLSSVQRIAEAQARTHAKDGLREWAQRFAPNLLWWEAAGAGISSLGVLAMLATPTPTHARIADAYLAIDALGALLDALVDQPIDELNGNPNWLDHYESEEHAAERLSQLVDDAWSAIQGLPHAHIHKLLLAGLVAHNLTPRQTTHQLIRLRLATRPIIKLSVPLLRIIRGTVPHG